MVRIPAATIHVVHHSPSTDLVGELNTANMTQHYATELVILLSLVLTTVVQSDRDLAKKTLMLIGERCPVVLFTYVVTSLEFNNPYVPERMLAAAYGTTLSLIDSEAAITICESIIAIPNPPIPNNGN